MSAIARPQGTEGYTSVEIYDVPRGAKYIRTTYWGENDVKYTPFVLNNIIVDENSYLSEISEISFVAQTTQITEYFANVATGDVEVEGILYKAGDIVPSTHETHRVLEIELISGYKSISYKGFYFVGDYGFALFDKDNNLILSQSQSGGEGFSKYYHYNLEDWIQNGAVKARFSVMIDEYNPEYPIISYDDDQSAFAEYAHEKLALLNKDLKNVKSLIKYPKYLHYNTLGSPKSYTCDLSVDGIKIFDTLDELYSAYDALAESYPNYFKREEDIGMDETSTYGVRHYTLRNQHPLITNDRAGNNENQWDDEQFKCRRIILNMGVHCAERPAILGGYLAVKEILESDEEWAMFIKNNFVIDVIPCVSPWSAMNGWISENVNGFNLNRTYFSNIQQENINMINLIEDLIHKGLVGVIDVHNTGDGDGYFVAKKNYSHWNYYGVLTQQIASLIKPLMDDIFGTERNNHFHLWDATGNNGQLHEYADSKGLLGCTYEIKGAAGVNGAIATKVIAINLIQMFGTYEGD